MTNIFYPCFQTAFVSSSMMTTVTIFSSAWIWSSYLTGKVSSMPAVESSSKLRSVSIVGAWPSLPQGLARQNTPLAFCVSRINMTMLAISASLMPSIGGMPPK